ncbi:type II CAAX endopeptidase family protein [Microbacterium sp. PRC9]|uniref:CPBP family intramembrane glutamic endopeptidase n=1 Tax=Microbacterium sp. PRC9 TaxID=2962591 RepID=UPI0028819502|nr:type II CAAX endopeptidase family protein [Microbacterium sp. PRC9]MDT0143218.1 type II CAAX endopeptidase family protein [Microbacterium sp. PRC9]
MKPPTGQETPTRDRIPRVLWVGLVAAIAYVLIAAGGGLLVDAALGADPDPVIELAASHLIPLPIAIGAGLLFAWRSGWWHDIWTDPPIHHTKPRRWWMLLVPLAIAAQIVVLLIATPWAQLSAAYIFVGLLCYLLVGLGEELFFRGILLESVRAHHGETVTLLVTAIAFGVAHAFGSSLAGVPLGTIAFQVGVTAMEGVLFYAALRAAGTLWVPIVLHGLGDWGRWLTAENDDSTATPAGVTQIIMTVLSVAVLISVILEDRRARKARAATHPA